MTMSAEGTISDLVPLMYRARWLRYSLSGEVRSRRKRGGDGGYDELSGSLQTAPGGLYRADLVDEDGERELSVCDEYSGRVPFPDLLIPSWLLAHFDLKVTGQTDHVGRAAYAIAGQPRQGGEDTALRVSALVDAELGVLLRYEETGPHGQAQTAEFTSLTVGSAGSADPLPSPDLSDDQVNVLYRSVLEPPTFAADLNEQADVKTMTRLAQAALTATEPGRRTSWLWQSPADPPPEDINLTARLQVAMPDRYRIDAVTDPGTKPVTTACDGDRLWLVYPDRIAVRPAAPPPAGICVIVDSAWLLHEYPLSVAEAATDSGRPALRVVAERTDKLARGPLSGTPIAADKVEVTVDVQLGVALSQIWYLGGHPVFRTELSAVTPEVDLAAFRIEPPPGTRVITGGLLAEAGLSTAGAAWTAARGTAKLATEIGRRWARRPRP
jgi:outer membrane lipoprotein-sorting protein